MSSRWARRTARVACVIVAAAMVTRAQPQPRNSAVSVDTREGTMIAFDISPDGRTIVFDLLGQLWLLPAQGGDAIPLTNAVRDNSEDLNPVFSPDGARIVFQADRRGGGGLWVMSLSDRVPRRLTTGPDTSPAWSPRGDQIAFARSGQIYVCVVASCSPRRLSVDGITAAGLRDPMWSRDGQRLFIVNGAIGGRVWELPIEGGTAQPVTNDVDRVLAPVPAPDGGALACLVRDANRDVQLFVRENPGEPLRKLTAHADTTALRVRWHPDGQRLLYAADGQLWSVPRAGGSPVRIAFRARLAFPRLAPVTVPVSINPWVDATPARGHMGIGLSPDGRQVAMIALGKLWLIPTTGGNPHAAGPMPARAAGVSWSPDGREVAFADGPGGAEDLFAVDVTTGRVRRVTAIPGSETQASWSPDGRSLAFLHWRKPVSGTAPSDIRDSDGRLRVVAANATTERLEDAQDLGEVPRDWLFRFFPLSQERPQWNPDSSGLLVVNGSNRGSVRLLAGSASSVAVPAQMTFVQWTADGRLIFVRNNGIWHVPFSSERGATGDPTMFVDSMCLYASVSYDGTMLCQTADGLSLREPSGRIRHLGWPVTFSSRPPPPLLLRGARIIDGVRETPTPPMEVLLQEGRIARIAALGSIVPDSNLSIIDVSGKVLIPGLIELHGHLWDDVVPPGLLYHGITTMRDLGAPIGWVAGLRDAIDAGAREGPRLLFGGFQVWSNSGATGDIGQSPADDESRRRAIAFVRGSGGSWTKIRQFADWDPLAATIRASHAAGLRVTSHIAVPLPIIAAGLDGAEHQGPSSGPRAGEIIYDDIVQLFKAAGLWVVPTITAYAGVTEVLSNPSLLDTDDTQPFVTPFLRWWALRFPATSGAGYARFARFARESTAKLRRAGVVVAAGSDDPTIPWALHRELAELVAAGMTPMEAVQAATSVSARILGVSGQLGSLVEGAIADIVVLDADPLADIRNTRQIHSVIKGGRVVDRAQLLRQLPVQSP